MWYLFGAKQLWETRQDKKTSTKKPALHVTGKWSPYVTLPDHEPWAIFAPEGLFSRTGNLEIRVIRTGAYRSIPEKNFLCVFLVFCLNVVPLTENRWNQEGPLQPAKWFHWASHSFNKSPEHMLYMFICLYKYKVYVHILYTYLVTVLSDKRETYIVTCGCTFDAGKVPALLYTSLLKGVWMQTQNQTKHTGSKNRGLLLSWNQLSLCYTQKPYVCFYSAPNAFGSEITPSKIKLWFWAWP